MGRGRTHGTSGKATRNAIIARKIVREKYGHSYIELLCEHYTTPEDQLLYRDSRPARGKYYCEKCYKWVTAKPRPPRPAYPDQPMF